MKPANIYTFCRWWSKSAGEEIGYTHFMAHAMQWKFGAVDEKQLRFVCHAFYKSGYIPRFAEEYWFKKVLPFIRINGGVS